MVYYFYFLLVGSRRNECNSLLGREGGEVRSLLLTLSVMLNLFSSFTDDKMILKAITIHDKFIIILSRYIVCLNVCHALHDAHLVARIRKHLSFWRYIFRASRKLFDLFPLSLSQILLNSFLLEPIHRKKKYYHIPDAASERV